MEGVTLSSLLQSQLSLSASHLSFQGRTMWPFYSAKYSKTQPLVPSKSPKRTHQSNDGFSPSIAAREGQRVSRSFGSEKNAKKLNLEVSPHRAVAAVRLLRIDQGGAYADLLNEKGRLSRENEMAYVERTLGFRTRDLDDRDIRLVTNIVGGAVRWRRYLDHLIMSVCHEERTFRNMEPLLLQILRVGFYEIIKLDMPPYAVVDQSVRLAKDALRPGAGNMVNGVMRKLVSLKETNSLPLPKLEGDERAQARALAINHSHPVWMVRRWIKSLGKEEAVRLMNWNNSNPTFSVRVNTAKGYTCADLVSRLKALEVSHELSNYINDFVRIQTGMQFVIQAGLLREGLCSVQDEAAGDYGKVSCPSSESNSGLDADDTETSPDAEGSGYFVSREPGSFGLVVHVVDPQPGERIFDCCAAPGGKSLFMASRLRGQGMILAIDINEGRLRILNETSKLHSLDTMITPIHADLRVYSEKCIVKADRVLLDAPCSGLGVLSKRADLRWNRSLEDLEQLKNLQDELLDAASLLVKPGGILVYSTCSIDPDENEERIGAFLIRHPEFVVDPVDGFVPPDFVTKEGFYFSSPVKHSIDGSFAARLVRLLDDSA